MITTKIDRNNRVTTWSHDKHNRPISETWYSSWQSFYENKFDNAERLTNISHTNNSNKTVYADYDLKWDNRNRITDCDFTKDMLKLL